METPFVSFLVPTLNSARTLRECLGSIVSQDWPAERREIVVADAGSTDATLAIAAEHGAKVVQNPLKTGEAGKAAAAKAAKGGLLALVDSDNVLPDPDWLRRMVAPFEDGAVVASEPLRYVCRPSDPPLVRYFAHLGMNDPFCLFVGNYDRECAVTGRWTGLPVRFADKGGHLVVTLESGRAFPTIGANGFVIRRSALAAAKRDPYWFDVDILRDVAAASPCGEVHVAKVKTGIVHLYCATLDDFRRKQERRVRDFLAFHAERAPVPPGARPGLLRAVLRFSLAVALAFPLRLQARCGARRRPDPEAWALHGAACRATLRIYAAAAVRKALGAASRPADRASWRQ